MYLRSVQYAAIFALLSPLSCGGTEKANGSFEEGSISAALWQNGMSASTGSNRYFATSGSSLVLIRSEHFFRRLGSRIFEVPESFTDLPCRHAI
jgi:hypothetical protein